VIEVFRISLTTSIHMPVQHHDNVHDRDKWRALMKEVMNIRVAKNAVNFVIS